jgi:L-threonylcarbamoyladenylate synthase
VCFPTETTYGLAADIRSRAAIDALVALKGRDPQAPFGLIAADADQVRALARVWPEAAASLARAHWPGPLTLVVPARADLFEELVGPSGGVGVRVSSNACASDLARGLGAAITATSANPSGQPPALTVAEARSYFGDGVAIYLDGGPADQRTASTVVDVSDRGGVRVLRPGPVVVKPADA